MTGLGGCNFRCPYCHNHELVLKPGQLPGRPVEEVIDQLRPVADWLDGVVISGGEPTLSQDLDRLCQALQEAGFAVKLDTNGSRPRVLSRLIDKGLLEAVSMDLKAPLDQPDLHRRLSGVEADLSAVRHSVDLLLNSQLEVEFRTTVVPGLLDEDHLRTLCRLVKGAARYKLNAFRPLTCLDQSFTKMAPLTGEEQSRLQELDDGWLGLEAEAPQPEIPAPGSGIWSS
ncbi:MAG: anaerobic ribonucleoside-triphosphate reductase activating protein [Deltaproteobacteria bacterium]|nr:anaerobic ribonucleoside-triphosphate reductase activating protein [Deltaproteobacteria bacterium]